MKSYWQRRTRPVLVLSKALRTLTMRYLVCVAVALVWTTLPAQTTPARPQFDVASVRPTASTTPPMLREFLRDKARPGVIPMASPDRVRLQNWTLLDLVVAAYNVRATQVSGPNWLSDQDFDIDATVPVGTPKAQLNAMLQSLLAERFGLKVHRATKTGPGFALVVGKDGPRMKSTDPRTTAPAQEFTSDLTPEEKAQFEQKFKADAARKQSLQETISSCQGGFSSQSLDSITTEDLAARLVRLAGAPVIDETGLTGKYSGSIRICDNPDTPGGTVFDAVEKLGLKLEPRKVTVETVVVDQVLRTPTAN